MLSAILRQEEPAVAVETFPSQRFLSSGLDVHDPPLPYKMLVTRRIQ
jgi:hypothetical protein